MGIPAAIVRFIAPFIAAIALAGLPASALAEKWHRADTRSFIVYSDGDARTLKDFAQKLEMFDALFMYYFGLEVDAPPNRLTVYMLGKQEDVARFHGSDTVAGFYLATSAGSFAVANRERKFRAGGLSGETVLFHEYIHHVMARHFTFGYPPWYQEGFAEFFATTEIDKDGDWEIGLPPNHRVQGLKRGSIPLESVMFGDLDTMNPEERNSYYGRSWLLVHLTVFNPQRRNDLTNYLARVASGEEPREAFAASFGDLATLEAEMNRHVGGSIPSLKSQTPIAFKGEIAISSLDPVASALVPLSLSRRIGRERDGNVAQLQAFAALHPDRADVLAELALAEHARAERADLPDYNAAEAAIDAALALETEHARMLLLKAQIGLEHLAEADETSPAHWDEIGQLIARSYAADPSIPLTHVINYRSFLEQGERPPVPVINALGEAVMLAPEAHDIRLQYAWALANENAFDDAIGLIKFLASDPHQGGIGRDALRQLEDFRDRRLEP